MVELITDRTQADVDRAAELLSKGWSKMTPDEQAEWFAGLKGSYNHTDWNRVESVVARLSKLFGLSLVTKTDWTEWDVPTQNDVDRFLGNIHAIYEVGSRYSTTPTVPPSMRNMTYTVANDIEQIVHDIRKLEPSLFRCDELFCGEV